MRKTVVVLKKGLYLLLTEMIAVYLIAFPVHAFQVSSSSTGYVRVATASAVSAYQVAQRAAFTGAVASAISAPTAASVAVRIATGPVGWGLVGVSAALTLAQMYYSASDIQQLQTATNMPQQFGWTPTGQTQVLIPQGHAVMAGQEFPNHPGNSCGNLSPGGVSGPTNVFTPPYGLSGFTLVPQFRFADVWWWCASEFAGVMQHLPSRPATITEAQAFMNSLPAGNPNSIESQTDLLGLGVPASAADTVTTLPVSPTDVVPTVKPASQVAPTDVVIDPNAPAPAGPQPAVPSTQTTTTTTTTTTNPDGSVTQQEESTGSVACSAGNHDQRTFGSVLQDHMTLWQGSGLLSALTVLKTLTWPSAIPTYSLSSSLFGSFTLDFSAWSGLLTALRSLIIALAAFVAYRIIFVGNG